MKFRVYQLTGLILIILLAFTGCEGSDYYIEPKGENQAATKEVMNEETVNEPKDNPIETDVKEEEPEPEPVQEEGPGDQLNQREEVVEETNTTETLFINQFSTEDTFDLILDADTLDNTETSWTWRRNTDHEPVEAYNTIDISQYGGYYFGNTDEKVIYLTFDEGYEKGYTNTILDILADNGVQATFFVTKYYIDSNPELIDRMAEEGHLVGNHSATHPSLPTLSDEEIYSEITETANAYKSVTGQDMDPFLRPPEGTYSERTLYLTRKLGYRTIFYSIAYGDWDVDNQPGADVAYDHVMTNYHNGAIILLHAVSQSNTEALDDIIKSLKAEGYRFGSLYELE